MANRNREYYREAREKAIARKRSISKDYWHVKADGVLNKGKIHCSCWLCSQKSKYRGRPIGEQRRYPSIALELDYSA